MKRTCNPCGGVTRRVDTLTSRGRPRGETLLIMECGHRQIEKGA